MRRGLGGGTAWALGGRESDAESSASLHTGAEWSLKSQSFQVKEQRIALLLCQAKDDTVDSRLEKVSVPPRRTGWKASQLSFPGGGLLTR